MSYTSKTQIENYLLKDIDASFDSQITDWINSVEQYIDNITDRTFEADMNASTRLFMGGKRQKLIIDDCIEITKAEIGDEYGDSFTETTDYVALPLNTLPKTSIGLKDKNWGVGIHRITAKWGYSENAPDDITFAATILAAGIVNAQTNTGSKVKSEKIGNYSITYTDQKGLADFDRALEILQMYKRYYL